MPIKPQAREIIRYAKRNNLKLTRGGISIPNLCARGVLAHSVRVEENYGLLKYNTVRMFSRDLPSKLNMSQSDLDYLEQGFENLDASNINVNRYYKVGQRVAELAGIV